jgi:hypothetical protein
MPHAQRARLGVRATAHVSVERPRLRELRPSHPLPLEPLGVVGHISTALPMRTEQSLLWSALVGAYSEHISWHGVRSRQPLHRNGPLLQ